MSIQDVLNLINNENYSFFITLLALIFFIYGIYQRVKFLCLQKASEMIAAAESHSELSGEEKFSLVLSWINSDLPKIFNNSLFQELFKKLIEFAYSSSFTFMQRYVKRKTGFDISELIDQNKDK